MDLKTQERMRYPYSLLHVYRSTSRSYQPPGGQEDMHVHVRVRVDVARKCAKVIGIGFQEGFD